MAFRSVAVLATLAAAAAPALAQQWRMQYLYDEVKSGLTIYDIQFSSPSRGMAVGVVSQGRDEKYTALLTSDGGAHWQLSPLKELPLSLFLLNDSAGWLVTEKGIWKTTNGGKDWGRMPKLPDKAEALRVYFADANHGWAACANRTVLATTNGGKDWAALPETPPPMRPSANYGAFTWIGFANPQAGIITGAADQSRPVRLPDWLAPDAAIQERERPHPAATLQTHDGGKTWRSDRTSMLGDITRTRFAPGRRGVGLIEHSQGARYPSDVFEIGWPNGANNLIFHDEHFFVSDVWVTPGGAYYLAGIELASKLREIVPQKVKVLTSRDLKTWTPMAVDYRADANRVYLGGSGEDALWLATNTGMILKLTQ